MVNSKTIRRKIAALFQGVLKTYLQRMVFWYIVFFLAVSFIVSNSVMPENISLKIGQPSPKDFDAPRNITFESEFLTAKARKEAADKVEAVYITDESVLVGLQQEINDCFKNIKSVRNDEELDGLDKLNELKRQLSFEMDDGIYRFLIEADDTAIGQLASDALQILGHIMLPGVMVEDIDIARTNIEGNIALLASDQHAKDFLNSLYDNIELRGNRIYDQLATTELKEKAMDRALPVIIKLSKDQKVVGKGEIITKEHLEALEKLGILASTNTALPIVGVLLVVAIFFSAIGFYLYLYKRHLFEKESTFVLINLLLLSTLLIAKAVAAINLGARTEVSLLIAYMIPVAAGSMLIAILVDVKLSVFITALLAILIGITNGFELQFAFVAFAGGIAGIYSVSKLSQRSDLAKASVYIIAANVTAIIALGLMLNYSLAMLSVALLLGIINGVLSSVLTIGLLPFLENAFGVTTSVKLLELSNPNHPLMRRLLLEAPGTYHHSVVVGNLAEAAANAIGADSLLTRVGASYHDIGKVKRPYFFIENQLTRENPHDKLSPTLSTLIITAHVKDGIELAKEHDLPSSIVDIISQHHGSSTISYFYHKAKEIGNGDVQQDDYRYEYSKPQTKEAAIVMLADCVEAGVRSMQKPTPNKIEAFVRKSVKERLEDGQLEECDLTFKELDIIMQSFVKILTGIFHTRIEYPENVLKEMERSKEHGSISKQPTG